MEENNIRDYLKKQTLNEILPLLKQYESAAKSCIKKIIQYETINSLKDKEQSWFLAANNTIEDIRDREKDIYDKLRTARNQTKTIDIEKTLQDAYKLLNAIGELFHDEVQYSITLSKENGTKISFEMPIAQFLKNAVNITYTSGIYLRDSSALLKDLNQSRSSYIQKFDWSKNSNDNDKKYYDISLYNRFLYQKQVAIKGGVDINFNTDGNELESYFHWVNEKYDLPNYDTLAKQQHLGEELFSAMVSNLKKAKQLGQNSTPFWSGGDVNNLQIKGNNASVVATETLKKQLLKFVTMTSFLNLKELDKKLNAENLDRLEEIQIQKEIMKKLESFGMGFSNKGFNEISLKGIKGIIVI